MCCFVVVFLLGGEGGLSWYVFFVCLFVRLFVFQFSVVRPGLVGFGLVSNVFLLGLVW